MGPAHRPVAIAASKDPRWVRAQSSVSDAEPCPKPLLSPRRRTGRRRWSGRLVALVFDLDFRATDSISYGLGPLIGFLPDDDLLFHFRLFGDDRLLTMRGHVNCPLLEGVAGQAGSWAINRPMLDRHPLLTQ